MKIDLERKIKNLKGENLKIIENGKETKELLTVGEVLANVVLSPHQNKKGFRPLDALKLARKFYKDNEIDLEETELIQIRELIENSDIMPIVQGQLLEALELVEE